MAKDDLQTATACVACWARHFSAYPGRPMPEMKRPRVAGFHGHTRSCIRNQQAFGKTPGNVIFRRPNQRAPPAVFALVPAGPDKSAWLR